MNSDSFKSVCQSWIDGFEYRTAYDWTHGLRHLQERFGSRQFWEDARQAWRNDFEEDYIMNVGMVAHACYPQGPYEDYTKDGRSRSLEVLREIVDRAWQGWQYEEQNSSIYWNSGAFRSAAYALHANFFLEQAVGKNNMNLNHTPTDPDERFNLLLRKLESMAYQNLNYDWSEVPDETDDDGNVVNKVKPFMVGIGMHALALYHEKHGNDNWGARYFPNIEYVIVEHLRWMREDAKAREGSREGELLWDPNPDGEGWGAFSYQDVVSDTGGSGSHTWALNTVICPGYAYAGLLTGEPKYIHYADEIWMGAVQDGHPNYRWSAAYKEFGQLNFITQDYFRWRKEWKNRYG